jgi:hypothetical protein
MTVKIYERNADNLSFAIGQNDRNTLGMLFVQGLRAGVRMRKGHCMYGMFVITAKGAKLWQRLRPLGALN